MAHEYGKETLSKEFKSDRDKGLPDSELVEAVVALANTDGPAQASRSCRAVSDDCQ